jgi:hypothetical protein
MEGTTRLYGSGRRALLVLGMHRSGTSLLACLLNRVGAALPPDVLGPGPGNPLGHWEPKNLVEINDHVFYALKRRWDDALAIDRSWFHSVCAADLIRRIQGQIRDDYGQSKLLLIKDPRICRLLPLYLVALQNLDVEPLIILQVRPAEQVIQSLARRDGLAPELSALLWARSILEAERYSRDYSRVWMTFDNILTVPDAALDRISQQLGVRWPIKPSTREIYQIISQKCRGNIGRPDGDATHWLTSRVWETAELAISGEEIAARDRFDALWQALGDMDRMYTACFTKLYSKSEAMLDAVLGSTSWRITAPLRALKRFGRWTVQVRRATLDRPTVASDFATKRSGKPLKGSDLPAIECGLQQHPGRPVYTSNCPDGGRVLLAQCRSAISDAAAD